jgi:hypothetical protein
MRKQLNRGYINLTYNEGTQLKYIRVPLIWNSGLKQWEGKIITPVSNTLICGQGKNEDEVKFSFVTCLLNIENEEICREIVEMCMPEWYWEE